MNTNLISKADHKEYKERLGNKTLLNPVKNIILSNDLLGRSVKAQFKEADKMNAKWTIVVGDNEIESNKLAIKNMKSSQQIEISLDNISDFNFKA